MRPPQDRVTGPELSFARWGRSGCLAFLLGGLLLVAGAFALAGWNTVESGKVAVTRRFGEITGTRTAGGFWDNPIGFSMMEYDLRVAKTIQNQQAALKNQQTLFIKDAAYQYNLTPDAARKLLETVGDQQTFERNVVIPKLQNAMKAVTPQYTAEDVFPRRSEIEQKMEQTLAADLKEYEVAAGSVDITLSDVDFDPEFRKAIDAKAKAEQERLVELANLEKQKIRNNQEIQQAQTDAQRAKVAAEGQANAAVANAKGQAEATRTQAAAEAEANEKVGQSLSQDLIRYRYAQNWNGQLPSTMLGDNGFLPTFNVAADGATQTPGQNTSNGQQAGPPAPKKP
ncbi:MAG: prohibitin family protein [Chloroflexota bacterium]|nr:prohibitin family protein [Chloroflexota bacterium]